MAVLKRYCSEKGDSEMLGDVHSAEYHMKKGNHLRALDISEKALQKNEELEEVLQKIYEAEGIYQ